MHQIINRSSTEGTAYHAFVDVETTGRSAGINSTISLAAIITTPPPKFEFVSQLMLKIKPVEGRIIEQEALDINGLNPAWLREHAPSVEAAAHAFHSFMLTSPRPLMFSGYNTPFDYRFCMDMLKSIGVYQSIWVAEHYDVLVKARSKIRDSRDHKLVTIVEHLGLPAFKAHDAMGDIRATVKVARKLVKMEYPSAR